MQGDFYLGEWLVQPALCRLSANGRTVQVRPKVMDLLAYLAGHPGEVISKDRLLDDVWGTQSISESAMTRTVTELRQALGDSVDTPEILETIPKRGYRFIGQVTPVAAVTSAITESRAPRFPGRNRRGRIAAVSTAAFLVVLAAWLWVRGRADVPQLAFAERDWVLVADFENGTGEASFDGVLEQALERELIGSGFVNVVPRPRVEDALLLMKRSADERLDSRLAREVSVRDGCIRAILTGRIDRVGGTHSLTTNIIRPADGAIVAKFSDDVATPEDLLRRVRGQALRVRQSLGESLVSIERSRDTLEKVTTPSLNALQLYSRAARLLDGDSWRLDQNESTNRNASAEALLSQATEADPLFASAWLLLAHAVCNQNRSPTEYLPLANRALELSKAATPVERYLIEGFTYLRRSYEIPANDEDVKRSTLKAAARAYEALLQLAPDHYWALLELVDVYRASGEIDAEERVSLQAASMRPHSVAFALDSARAHLRQRDIESARAIVQNIQTAERHDPSSLVPVPEINLGWFRLWEAHERWLAADTPGTLAAVKAAERTWTRDNDSQFRFQLSAVYQGLGRFDDVLRVLNGIEDRFRDRLLAMVAARRERWEELRLLVRPERRDFDVLNGRLAMMIWAGWTRDAEWVIAERRRRHISLPLNLSDDAEGQLRVAQGRYAEGRRILEPLTLAKFGPRLRVDEAFAIAQRGLGNRAAAISHLERIAALRGDVVSGPNWLVYDWLRCRTLLAELYRDAGSHADASRVANEVRNLLAVADVDHPLLERLRKM